MARYHVNPRTGDPGVCNAKHACPYGDFEKDHFDSPAEARSAYEAGNLDQAFTTLSKALDETVDVVLHGEAAHGITAAGGSEEADELLAAIDKAGWPKFDPEKGPEQLHGDALIETLKGQDVTFVSAREVSQEEQDRVKQLLETGDNTVQFGGTGKTADIDTSGAVRLNGVTDDELIGAMDAAGWPKFDPAKGESQFEYITPVWHDRLEDAQVEFVDTSVTSPETQAAILKLVQGKGDGYEEAVANFIAKSNPQDGEGEAYPELTDETMQEMDAYYQANPLMSVEIDTSKGEPEFGVYANGELVYTTNREEVAALGNRISKAGVWQDFNAVDAVGKENTLNRYVKKGLYYISDARLDNEDRRVPIGEARGPKQVAELKEIENDDKLLDIAGKILIREAEAERGIKLFGNAQDAKPPF